MHNEEPAACECASYTQQDTGVCVATSVHSFLDKPTSVTVALPTKPNSKPHVCFDQLCMKLYNTVGSTSIYFSVHRKCFRYLRRTLNIQKNKKYFLLFILCIENFIL